MVAQHKTVTTRGAKASVRKWKKQDEIFSFTVVYCFVIITCR